MANGKKRSKSHRSPDWRPKAKTLTVAEQRVEAVKSFPVWGVAVLASNLGMLVLGGVISVGIALLAAALELHIMRRSIPTANRVLYCVLTFVGTWVLWFILNLLVQARLY